MNFLHIHVTASIDVRERRFAKIEEQEPLKMADGQPVEASIDELRGLAHIVVPNEGSLEELRSAIARALAGVTAN